MEKQGEEKKGERFVAKVQYLYGRFVSFSTRIAEEHAVGAAVVHQPPRQLSLSISQGVKNEVTTRVERVVTDCHAFKIS